MIIPVVQGGSATSSTKAPGYAMCGVAAMKARAVQRLATKYLAFKRTPEVSHKQPVYITAIARDHATEPIT